MTTTTTPTDDPSIEYQWRDWIVRHRTDNRSPRPWTVEHMGRRIATFDTADAARRQALRCIREDYGQQTAVRWKQLSRSQVKPEPEPPPTEQPEQPDQVDADIELAQAGLRLLDALERFVRCIHPSPRP